MDQENVKRKGEEVPPESGMPTGKRESTTIFENFLVTGDLYIKKSDYASLHYGNRGRLGTTPSFNPDKDRNGLWLEGSTDGSESGGIFMNGNTMCMWSPGDNDLLRIYDEDNFSSPKFLINRNGNVGIGTTDPKAKLSINGGLHVGGDSDPGNNNLLVDGDIYIKNTGFASLHYGNRGKLGASPNFNPDKDRNGLWLEGSTDGSESGGIFMNGNTMCMWSPGDNDLLRIYDEDNFSLPKFLIDSHGKVGIGTTDPNSNLHIKASWEQRVPLIIEYVEGMEWTPEVVENIFESLSNNSVILGVPDGNELDFFWKDYMGKIWYARLSGSSFE
jgi:hypothetical protein